MSRLLRCRPCFRGTMDTAVAGFHGTSNDVAAHVARTGHNRWEYLEPSTGRWERLGSYLGDGYFEADSPLPPAA